VTDSVDGAGSDAGGADQTRPRPTHPATELSPPPTHLATEFSPHRPTDEVPEDRTSTVPGRPRPGGRDPGSGEAPPAELRRHGPGVPAIAPGGQGVPTAEEVWRAGAPPGRSSGRPGARWRRRAGSALTVTLLIAVGLVIFLRLHHPSLRVTGVAITSQAKDGCSVNVTGRISTTGGAGTVSYQWVLTPQAGPPHPLSQSVTGGQSSVYVTAAIQGTSQLSRQVTLQVLGPGQGSATAHVIANC